MNALQTGAVALILIICIPILLGFGMATESVERTVSVESEDRNLSDLVLNSESDYYAEYTGPGNNSTFVQEIIYQGSTSYVVAAPDYVSLGSTYTSIPTYTSGTATLGLDAGSTDTHSGSQTYTVRVGSPSSGAGIYNDDIVRLANTGASLVGYQYYVGSTYYGDQTYNPGDFQFYRSGTHSDGSPLYTLVLPDSTEVENVRNFVMESDQNPTFTVYHRTATTVNIDKPYYTLSANGSHAVIPITHTDSTTEYCTVDDLDSLVYSSTHLYINDQTFNNVSSFGICLPSGYSQLTYSYTEIDSGSYADPSLGWRLPDSSYQVFYDYWTNGTTNESVTFDIAFTSYGTLTFEFVDSLGAAAFRTVTLVYSASGVNATVSGVTDGTANIGGYSHVRLTVDTESVTVSGIADWTYIGGEPDTYNTKTWETDNEPYVFVRMTDVGDVARFRVSESEILAGTFPSTEDCVLRLYDYYPNDDKQGIEIDSVGVYGDYLGIGGVQQPISDGTVTISDADTGEDVTINVLGADITYEYEHIFHAGMWMDFYTTYIDGHRVVTTPYAPELIFGGDWVVTLHRIAYTEETVVSEEWVAGEFAFDQDDFLLAMIITTVLVFVGLGLMRGVRIGVLAVVCGAAGIIAFIIA